MTSKLFNLKEWLTVADAAKHLTIVFDEEVTEADVLRLALDGRLQISVYFVNHARARCGNIVGPEEAKFEEPPIITTELVPDYPKDAQGKPYPLLMSKMIDDERFLNLSDEVTTIRGVWDLPMIGGERLDIEHAYHNLTGGPAVTLINIDGAFVERADGKMCELQESFDENEYQAGSIASLKNIERKFFLVSSNEDIEERKAALKRHEEDRKKYLEKRKSNPRSNDYYPTGGLPEDSVLVIRTEALREFEESLSSVADSEKPMTTTERNTLLTIIAALCEHSAIKYQERGAAGKLAKLTEQLGAPVSDDTIRKVLAKIANALEARMK